jgi:hypothetical protein
MVNSGMIIPHSTKETHTVRQIEFGLLNPEDIVIFINFRKRCQSVK